MRKISPKDGQFLFNAVVLSLVALGLIYAFAPYITTPETRIDEVRMVDRRIVSLSANEVPLLLRSADGRPVMLVVYASWCSYCRKLMPVVTQMVRERRLDHVSPVFLSMDYEPRKLSQYLVYQNFYPLFTPYMLGQGIGLGSGLPAALRATGSNFTGQIPYIGFFDAEGKVTGELFGIANENQIFAKSQRISLP